MFNRIFEIPHIKDERGGLSFLQNDGLLPFIINRAFWITNVPQGKERGHHSHRTCHELIVAVKGNFSVEIETPEGSKIFQLSEKKSQGLMVYPHEWCRLYDFSADAVCLCLASENYNAEGYEMEKVSH